MEHVRCDFCGSDDAQLLFEAIDTNYHRPGRFRISRCRACHLVYLDPRPSAQTIGHYDPDRDYGCDQHENDPGSFASHDLLVRLVARGHLKTIRLGDAGCGDGQFLLAATRTGWDVSGIE